ncbi:unnamed protein product [Pieris macdunnoughi]|uniref:Endonuclease/exonuclease/phosphatase domain-containing protein n=1 Tax=Pieris macdunnoughi TaxID=345717 RepID=A0A821XD38_9NEOP|nr:unnamed protein product [Pieris macdunnoughi]
MLEIYYQNVQGLRTKTASFLKYLSTSNYGIIALTETWLKSGISNMELFDNRYTVYRRDRSSSTNTKSDGGGVILGVSKEISSFRVEAWESDVEDLWVTLHININKIIKKLSICVVYLPPPVKIGTLTHFLDSVDRALNLSDDVIILGDFNLGFIDWRSLNNEVFMTPCNYNNTLGFALIDFMSMNSLKQFNSIGNSDDRFLDLVLSNMSSINVSAPSDSLSKIYANHPSLLLSFEYSKISFLRTRGNTKLNFYKADYVSIIGDLKTIDWNDSLRAHDDVNDMVSKFYKILNTTISKFVPNTTITKSKYPVWFSSSLIKLLAEKEKTRKRYRIYKNPRDEIEYHIIRKRCHKLYDDCYTKYKRNIEASIPNNPKCFWSFIKNRKGGHSSLPSCMKMDNVTAQSSPDIANLFSYQFSSVYTCDESLVGSSTPDDIGNVDGLMSLSFREDEISKKIKGLDTNKGAGPDSIPPIFVKRCRFVLSLPLTIIYNRSLKDGVFPEVWKRSRVVPVYKKGDITDVKNYRPVCILSCFSKLFESVLYPVISKCLDGCIVDEQHGFRKGRSIQTNLMSFVTETCQELDRGRHLAFIQI